jgi:hypothetical protein
MRQQTRNGRQPQCAPTRLPNDDHSVQRMWRGGSLKRRQFGGLLLGAKPSTPPRTRARDDEIAKTRPAHDRQGGARNALICNPLEP